MLYDPTNPLHREQARLTFGRLIKGSNPFELTEKRGCRSLSQNAYLHAALGYFALQMGETLEYVKQYYYKTVCNPDLYLHPRRDPVTGATVTIPRSSASLDKDEMSLSIDRFRNWAATHDVYIPSPEDRRAVLAMQMEVERGKQWI